jgi:hypothetical protein
MKPFKSVLKRQGNRNCAGQTIRMHNTNLDITYTRIKLCFKIWNITNRISFSLSLLLRAIPFRGKDTMEDI